MGYPEVDTCCSLIGLKAANILMGILNTVISTAVLGAIVFINYMENTFSKEINEICLFVVFMFLFKFFLDLLFIYGVVTKGSTIILTYFILWTVFFLLIMFLFFLTISGYDATLTFITVFYICINIYAFLLSFNYYRLLISTHEEIN